MENKTKLEALLNEQPDNFYANLKLAGYYRKEKHPESAIRCLNMAKSVFPRYVESDCPYKQLSEIYKEQNRLEEAIRELQTLTEQNDRDLDALKQLGRWLNDSGKPGEAIKPLQQAVYIDPFDVEIHQLLAEASAKQKDLTVALREFKALLSLDPPDKAIAHFNLANVLIQMGKRPEAKQEVLQSLEIAPGYEPAQELLLKVME